MFKFKLVASEVGRFRLSIQTSQFKTYQLLDFCNRPFQLQVNRCLSWFGIGIGETKSTLKGKINRNKIRFGELQSQYISENISINNPPTSFEK